VEDIKTTLKFGTSIAKNLALKSDTVASYYQRQRTKQGFSPEKDQTEYPLGVFHKHATALAPLRKGGLQGADVLEIGPGGNAGVSFLMLLAGAKSATCLDVIPWMQGSGPDALYPSLIEAAMQDPEKYQVAPEYLERALADPSGLARELMGRISYLYPVDIATNSLPDASQNMIFSHACFEHFADPDGSIGQIARLLRPGGATSHDVDLRDHRDFSRPLEFLRYNDTIWKLSTSNRPNGVRNRWRRSEYRAAFERHGMEVVYLTATQNIPVTEEMRSHYQPHFKTMSLDELSVVGILLVARKRD
jgi:SAM-dependent methyltransferase